MMGLAAGLSDRKDEAIRLHARHAGGRLFDAPDDIATDAQPRAGSCRFDMPHATFVICRRDGGEYLNRGRRASLSC